MKKIDENEPKRLTQRTRNKVIKRLTFDIFTFLFLIILGTFLLIKSFNFETEKVVKYSEKSKLDYNVCLLENDFYENKCLQKDMLYVANLIDKILIDFEYKFESEDREDIDFTYSVVAKLTINNNINTKSYFEKTYTLLEDKSVSMVNTTSKSIREQIELDYPYYNQLANGFKNLYGVDVDSKLTVYMLINKKNGTNANFVLDNSSVMNIIIPVSEKSVDIKLDYKEIDETSNIIKKQTMTVKDYIPLIVSVIFIVLALIMMVKAMRNINKLRSKKSSYDKYVSKILKEYDRLIAESGTLLSMDGKEIIHISKFTELLDIHDNLQIPIMYFEAEPHSLSYFYINHDKMIYLLTVDADDMDDKK